jgi:alkylation response protein AidB-like acyl-CoA dehydrogenase
VTTTTTAPPTTTATWTDGELAAFEVGLTAENLTAVMRSTWTWDDRALRRDLARLLVALTAVGELTTGSDAHRVLRGRTLEEAAAFLAGVLGPRLVADAGHPPSQGFGATLVRSPWLSGGLEEANAVRALGAQALHEPGTTPRFDPASSREFATALAIHALSASGDHAAGAEYLARIQVGALAATLAAAEASGSWDPALVRTRAVPNGSRWTLDGEKLFVPHADTADLLLVIARSTAGPSLFAVDRAAAGLTIAPMPGIDPTRPLARLALSGVPATLVGVEGAGGRLMAHALDLATVTLAEEQARGARRALELAVPALSGQPDGRGELVAGEVALRCAVAEVMAARAKRLVAAGSTSASIAAAMAHVSCAEAFTSVARTVVPLCGADDGTEAEALFRRALSSELLFGGPAVAYERLLERIGV